MSGASAAIGRIELDHPTQVTRVRLPEPADDVEAYAVDGPPGMAALLAARGGIDGLEPGYLVSGINIGTNTGHSILHSGTVGAALTAATFGLSGLAVSLAVSKPMAWDAAYDHVEEAIDLLDQAPRATVLNVNVPVPQGRRGPEKLRWAELDRFGSFRVAVAERRDAEVQLEYRARGSGHRLDPDSDTALVDCGIATVTALRGDPRSPTATSCRSPTAADPRASARARPRRGARRAGLISPTRSRSSSRLGLGEPLAPPPPRLARLARRRLRSVRLAVEATCLGPCRGDGLCARLDAARAAARVLLRPGRLRPRRADGSACHRLEPGRLERLREPPRDEELRLGGGRGTKRRRDVAQHGVGDTLPVVGEQRPRRAAERLGRARNRSSASSPPGLHGLGRAARARAPRPAAVARAG